MTTITVREACPDDVGAVVALAERGWRAAYEGILDPETIDEAMAQWYDPDELRRSLDRSDTAFYVATDGGCDSGDDTPVVGSLRGGFGEDVAHLGALYVEPDRWGEGIGSRLLDRFESFCADGGYETIEFAVLAGNEVGQSFYRSHGYEAVTDREVELFSQTVADRIFRGPSE